MKLWKVSLAISAVLSLAAVTGTANADTFDYNWVASGGQIDTPSGGTITFTTTATAGTDKVTGITGSFEGEAIAGISATGNENIYPNGTPIVPAGTGTPNVFDTTGISVNLVGGASLGIFSFFSQGSTDVGASTSTDGFSGPAGFLVGNFILTTPVPLSPSWVMMLFGLVGLGACGVRSSKKPGTGLTAV